MGNKSGRSQCIYKKSRIHSTDLRPFFRYSKMVNALRNNTFDNWNSIKNEYADAYKTLVHVTDCKSYTSFLVNYLKHKTLSKEILKAGLRDITSAVNKMCQKKKYYIHIMNLVKLLHLTKKPTEWNTDQFRQFKVTTFESQPSIIHDIYTFAMNPPQKNIFFYGGLEHADTLTILLNLYGYKTVKHIKSNMRSCIELGTTH